MNYYTIFCSYTKPTTSATQMMMCLCYRYHDEKSYSKSWLYLALYGLKSVKHYIIQLASFMVKKIQTRNTWPLQGD